MKIACLASSQVPSSTANSIQVMKVCQALAQVSSPLRLWLPGDQPAGWNELAERYGIDPDFEINWLPSPRFWRRYDFAWKAARQAAAWGAEIIYTWLPQAALLGLQQGRAAILEMHDRPSGRLGPWLFRLFLRQAGRKRLLVTTHALRRILAADYGAVLNSEFVQIAPNGCEPERYAGLPDAAGARRRLGLAEGVTVVYSGHLYAGRGMELICSLAQKFPGVNFLCVGGRPQEVASWQAQLASLGVKNVQLTGFIENRRLPLYQAAADVLLMPHARQVAGSSGGNIAEVCSPMKMFDYLAAGRAILSSDLPVFHEVLNENNCVFCPPEDLTAWQAALGELLADDRRRQRLARQAKADSLAYSWRARAERALAGFE